MNGKKTYFGVKHMLDEYFHNNNHNGKKEINEKKKAIEFQAD